MKSFLQHITEAFDSPYPIYQAERAPEKFPDGRYIIYRSKVKSGFLDVEIANIGETLPWEISFTVNGAVVVSNQNEPMKIFSTVLKAVEMFLKQYKKEAGEFPMRLSFIVVDRMLNGKNIEDARPRIYRRLIDKFGKKYGFKFNKESSEGDYTLTILSQEK